MGGPRYALTGSEAYSCYPAPGQIGKFYETLPHIVFDRCTLPWERTIDGTDPDSQALRPRSLSLAGADPADRRRFQRGGSRQAPCAADFRDDPRGAPGAQK